jgi:hypothetical protein
MKKYFVFAFLLILFLTLYIIFNNYIAIYVNIKDVFNYFYIQYHKRLFNSIKCDHYNLSQIYNNSYNSIKIKHKFDKTLSNLPVCVLGVLVNKKGLEIEKSMLEWLLLEYDVYCVYQKYPGKLYEYPALRFAQWLSIEFNISIILYVHTKGAFYPREVQKNIRILWKNEFTEPRKKLYINLLKNNISDISLPFRHESCTWYNGMFISNRAFQLKDKIDINSNRYYYESLFKNDNKSFNYVRFKGVLNDSISGDKVAYGLHIYIKNLKKLAFKNKIKIINNLIIIICFLIFCIYLKKL